MTDKTVAELMARIGRIKSAAEARGEARILDEPSAVHRISQELAADVIALEQAIRRAVDWGEPHAWLTTGTIDGKRRLSMGAVTTNPEYKKMHKEWEWTPLYARRKGQ